MAELEEVLGEDGMRAVIENLKTRLEVLEQENTDLKVSVKKLGETSGLKINPNDMFPIEKMAEWLELEPEQLHESIHKSPEALLGMVFHRFNGDMAHFEMELENIGINEFEGSSIASVIADVGSFFKKHGESPAEMSEVDFKKISLKFLQTYENLPKWLKVNERRMNSCLAFAGLSMHLLMKQGSSAFHSYDAENGEVKMEEKGNVKGVMKETAKEEMEDVVEDTGEVEGDTEPPAPPPPVEQPIPKTPVKAKEKNIVNKVVDKILGEDGDD